jgi:hypothetical protein
MDPKSFLDLYTYLKIVDPVTNLPVDCGISNYGSGWESRQGTGVATGSECQTEYVNYFLPALRMAHHGKPYTPTGSPFHFDQNKVANIDPSETFTIAAFIRAFNGKGSPDDIASTLRVARAVGRIGFDHDPNGDRPARPSVAAYSTAFMTLDCNALVGNYFKIDPNSTPHSYAVAARARKTARDVAVGDPVVTVTPSGEHEHIGLIQGWTVLSDSSASEIIVEWGGPGDESSHYTGPTAHTYDVTTGPIKTYGIGFATEPPKFRYIFAPPVAPP